MKTEERKRREKAKFKHVDDEFIGLFGYRTHGFIVEASVLAGIDLRDWSLRIANSGVNAYIDPTKKEFVVERGIITLKNCVRKFILLHELGHLRQDNMKRFSVGPAGPLWDGRLVPLPWPWQVTPKNYAARPWERDASDFAMASPLFEKVNPNDFEGVQGNLLDTLKEHLKIPRII